MRGLDQFGNTFEECFGATGFPRTMLGKLLREGVYQRGIFRRNRGRSEVSMGGSKPTSYAESHGADCISATLVY